jgi:hypothetical protein
MLVTVKIVFFGLSLWAMIVRAAGFAVVMFVMGMPLVSMVLAILRLECLAVFVRRTIGHIGLQSVILLFDTLK